MLLRGTWKAYVSAFAVFRVHDLIAKADAFPTILQHAYLALGLVGLVPILGFILHRPLFNRRLWQVWFFLAIAWGMFDFVFYSSWFHLRSAPEVSRPVVMALAALVALPCHIAVYSYAFRSPQLWARPGAAAAEPSPAA
jgi:hypothetical protein